MEVALGLMIGWVVGTIPGVLLRIWIEDLIWRRTLRQIARERGR